MREEPTSALLWPVLQALARVGVTQDDIFSGPIKFTELDWLTPPLMSKDTLGGIPFHEYLTPFLPWVNGAELYGFWVETLSLAHTAPHQLYTKEKGWRRLSRVMPVAFRPGWRKLWLPLPPGLPYIDDYMGALLSVDVAHVARLSGLCVGDFVETENDYYGTLASGDVIGLRRGVPALPSPFDIPALGMVSDMLETTRGELWAGCDYDVLSKLRSCIWEHRDKLPEFDGLDLACQTMRVLSEGKGTAYIAECVRSLKRREEKLKVDAVVLRRCKDLVDWPGVSDARKIEGLRSMLVPAVMTITEFRREFYSKDDPPAMVSDKVMTRIQASLRSRLMQAGALDESE